MKSRLAHPVARIKIAVFLACLVPAARLAWKAYDGTLGANPIEFITLSTGIWTLGFLMATLAITPLRRITGVQALIRFRRMLGLFSFFYASLHFLTWIVLDQFFDWNAMVTDVRKRPFITMGFTAFVLLTPLALTSTQWAIRKMGGRRWQMLHRLIYVAAIAAVIHFWWKVKADVREPLVYAAILGVLLAARLVFWARKRAAGPVAAPAAGTTSTAASE